MVVAPRPRSGPRWLLIGLLIGAAYAAFWHGATNLPAETRLQVFLAVLALIAVVVWFGAGSPPPSASPRAALGVGLLLAFAVWCGLSLLWSVDPQNSWTELNRAIAYALVAGLALATASRVRSPAELVGAGWLIIAVLVALYALGGKVFPEIQIPGLFNLNQTALFSRLRAPLDYWNALGLVCVLGAPVALRFATDVTRKSAVRIVSLVALALLLVTVGLTYSRGAILALVVAMLVTTWLGGPRLRGLAAFALAALAAFPALAYGFSDNALTHDGARLSQRVVPGLVLGLILAACLAGLVLAARRLLAREVLSEWDPERAAFVFTRLRQATLGLVALAAVVLAASGVISHVLHSFSEAKAVSVTDPARILSTNSGNRWVWWKEAAGAFSARPLLGWGAGSFPITHLLFRRPPALPVQQPHSVPLQWLAETGIIGALLATGAYGLLTAAAVGSVRRKEGSERLIAASLLAMIVIYGVHALFDWDWDIPGVTLPMLIAVGVLVGADRLGTARSARSRAAPAPRPTRPPAAGPAARTVTLLAVAGALCAIALSGVVPSLAAGRASAALVAATSSSGSGLNQARSDAAEAARLDPFSDAGLVASATIALHSGQNRRARSYLLQAVRRDPQDVRAWQGLTVVDFGLGLTGATFNAIRHVVALDPKGPGVKLLTKQVELLLTPPSGSATARPSPAAAR